MFYAALDVSLRSVSVCIIDQDGKIRFERSVPSEVPDVVRCLRAFGETIHQVGFEAGTLTQHLTYGLREAGYDVVCMEARQVSAALVLAVEVPEAHRLARVRERGGEVRRQRRFSAAALRIGDQHRPHGPSPCRPARADCSSFRGETVVTSGAACGIRPPARRRSTRSISAAAPRRWSASSVRASRCAGSRSRRSENAQAGVRAPLPVRGGARGVTRRR